MIERRILQQESSSEANKGSRISRRGFLKGAAVAAGYLAGQENADAANALISGGQIREQRRTDGKIEYRHSDPETTHILNIISGYENLTRDDRISLLRADLVRSELNAARENPTKRMNSIDWAEASQVKVVAEAIKRRFYMYDNDKFLLDSMDKLPSELVVKLMEPWRKPKPNPELYDAIWRIDKQLKEAKINWGIQPMPGKTVVSRLMSMMGKELILLDGAIYAPGTNTLYISSLNFSSWKEVALENWPSANKIIPSEDDRKKANLLFGPTLERLNEQIAFRRGVHDGVLKILDSWKTQLAKIYAPEANQMGLEYSKKWTDLDEASVQAMKALEGHYESLPENEKKNSDAAKRILAEARRLNKQSKADRLGITTKLQEAESIVNKALELNLEEINKRFLPQLIRRIQLLMTEMDVQ